jgi:hypothetical protein
VSQQRNPFIIITSSLGIFLGLLSFCLALRSQATILTDSLICLATFSFLIALIATMSLAASQSSGNLIRLMGRTGGLTLLAITFAALSSSNPSFPVATYALAALAILGLCYLVSIMLRVGLRGPQQFDKA